MLIGTRQNVTNRSLSIYIHNSLLEQTNSFKLLGVIFDSNLSFNDHIHNLTKKLSSKLAFINRISKFLSNKVVSKLYAPLVQSHMDYGLTIWGNCGSTNMDKVQKMQNRASRIFSNNFRRNIPSSVILNKLDWMTVLNRRDYLLSVLINKLLNNCDDINNCLNIDFHLASDTHNYPTRYSRAKSLSVSFAKLDYYKRSLNVTGAKIVNSLSYDLFKLPNISLFKTQSKFIFKSK